MASMHAAWSNHLGLKSRSSNSTFPRSASVRFASSA
jgi:hypothetical protein